MASPLSPDYEIGRITDVCAATGRHLEPGDRIVTALVPAEEGEGFARLDYSMEAWESGERPGNLFAYWMRTVPHPEERERSVVDTETVASLFEQLEESREPRSLALRYVLALLMMRKRMLTYVGHGELDGWPCMLVRPRGEDKDAEPLHVIDPELDEETISSVTAQLQDVLRLES